MSVLFTAEGWYHHHGGIRVFSCFPLPENTNFDNHPWTVVPWWSLGVQWSCNIPWMKKKYLSLDLLEMVREQFRFAHITSSPRQHGSVSRETFLACDFSQRRWEIVSECSASPVCRMSPKLLSSPVQNTESWIAWLRQWVTEKTAARAQSGMYQRDADPTSVFADYVRKPTHELLGVPCLWISTTSPQTPLTCCMPHASYLMAISLCTSLKQKDWSFANGFWAYAESQPYSVGLEETTQIWGGVINTWLGFAGSTEGIES